MVPTLTAVPFIPPRGILELLRVRPRCDSPFGKILSSFPLTSSYLSPKIIMSCPVLIYLSCPYLKPIQKLFFPNTDWTHPIFSLLRHIILLTLAFYSISPNFAVTIDPTLILFFSRLSSFSSFIFFPTG